MSNFTVLIVEDHPQLREIYEYKFSQLGYSVYQARSGNTGIKMAKKVKPDLVILDMIMADGSGEDFLNAFPERDFHVVVVSYKEIVDCDYDKFFSKVTTDLKGITTYVEDYERSRNS